MKYRILFFSLFIACAFSLKAQHSEIMHTNEYAQNTFFVNGANLRDKPSLHSNIIGELKHNNIIERDYSVKRKARILDWCKT